MGLFENGLKGNIVSGLAIGVGATILAPLVIPVLANVVRPLTKGLIKQSILLYEKGAEKLAEAKEAVEDLVAEVRAETAGGATAFVAQEMAAETPPPAAEEVKSE